MALRGDVTNVDDKLLCLLPGEKMLSKRKMGVGSRSSLIEERIGLGDVKRIQEQKNPHNCTGHLILRKKCMSIYICIYSLRLLRSIIYRVEILF